MTSPIPKIKEDQPLDEFEFLDVDDDLEYYKEPPKSPISDSVKKIGSGVSLIFSALCTISEEQGFVVKLPVKSIATTAVSTLTGTLIGGVPGMAVGFLTGAVMSYRKSGKQSKKGQEKCDKTNLRQVIGQMSRQEKVDLLTEIIKYMKHKNVKLIVSEICKNEEIKGAALKILSDFLLQRMGLSFIRV